MKILPSILAGALFTISFTATATVIDFQSLESNSSSTLTWGNTYTEDGFTITNLSSTGSWALATAGTNSTSYYAGSTALINNHGDGITQLKSNSGAIFDLLSIDLSEIDIFRLGPTTVDFTGNLSGGGTITQSFNLDGIFGLQTFLFSGFNNLTSVTWVQSAEYHQFDNIQVIPSTSSVPIPSTLTLLGLGLAGFRFSARKRFN